MFLAIAQPCWDNDDSHFMAKSSQLKELQLSLLNITSEQADALTDVKAEIDVQLDQAFEGFIGNEGTVNRLRTMLKAAKLRGDGRLSRVIDVQWASQRGQDRVGRAGGALSVRCHF